MDVVTVEAILPDVRPAHSLSVVQAGIDCPSCRVPFAAVSSPGEAEYLAGVHNQLQHGGAQVAAPAPTTAVATGPSVSLAGLGWSADPAVLADARGQAFPFGGERTAVELAWSARVQAAVNGMDVVDPGGLDVWMDRHAASEVPHVAEAELVAVWETHVRALCDDLDAATSPSTTETAPVESVIDLTDADEDAFV